MSEIRIWMWLLLEENIRVVAATSFGRGGNISAIGRVDFLRLQSTSQLVNLIYNLYSPDGSKHTRLLFIGYPSAFEIWDCSDLESLHQVLSINTGRKSGGGSSADLEWCGRVVRGAAAAPGPRRKGAKDPFRGDRPLIGVL